MGEAGRNIRARRNKLAADCRLVMFGFTGVIGVFLAAVRAEWFVWPFLTLKTAVDIGALLQTTGVLKTEKASGG